ncbi:unnamed protein product [Ectocarpus fasciculatus]
MAFNFSAGGAAAKPSTGGFSFGASAAPAPAAPAAPAAAPTFSFSSTPAAAATPAPAPAATGGGFSFGAKAAPAAAAPAAASGGFSFGAASAPAPAAATASTTATTTAPAAGGGLFGGAAGSTAGGGAAATTAAAKDGTDGASGSAAAGALTLAAAGGAGTTEQEQPPEQYMNMTVEEIVNSWNVELDQDATTFTNEAVKVSDWDVVLRETQSELFSLADDVQKLVLGQQDLARSMKAIEGEQSHLDKTLDQLEGQAEKLMHDQRGQSPEEGDVEREQAFQIAQTVDMQLAGMVDTLKSLVDQVNSSTSSSSFGGVGGRGDAGGDSNARKIVRILNAHHHSLTWLEETSKTMLQDAADVGRRLGMPSDAALLPP